jgi:two-component system sensor histidine kinase YesM
MRYRFSLRNKLMIVVLPLIVVSYIFLAFIANQLFSREVIAQVCENIENESYIVNSQISSLFRDVSNCAKYIMYDFNYQKSDARIPEGDTDAETQLQLEHTLQTMLYQYAVIFPQMESIALVDQNKHLYISKYNISLGWNGEKADKLLRMFDGVQNEDRWFPFEKRDYLTADPDKIAITMGKRVTDITTNRTICYVIINLGEKEIRKTFSDLEIQDVKTYYVITDGGLIISCSDEGKILTSIQDSSLISSLSSHKSIQTEAVLDGKKNLVTAIPIRGSRLYLLNVYKTDQIAHSAGILSNTVMLTCLGILIIIVFLVNFFSKQVTNSLSKLTDEMEKVKNGSFQVNLDINSGDEIEKLAEDFKLMLQRIDILFSQLSRTEKEKLQSQLALMQSQIQPHFLYNTLDLIYVLESMGRTSQAMISVKALADFYRTALSGGEEVITIAEEIQNTENYLKLQSIRFADVFEYTLLVDPDILRYKIPKLTLQPIVENAITHGLHSGKRKEKGCITVTGKMENDFIRIYIRDNGIGISSAKLNLLRYNLEKRTEHFGLYNTNHRLKLYFGDQCGLDISSTEGEGTTVAICLTPREGEANGY